MTAVAGIDDSGRRSRVLRGLVAAVVLAGAGGAAYRGYLPGIFVLDDFASVIENPTIRQLGSPAEWLFPPRDAGVGGRPWANFSLAVNHAISGLEPWSYHAGNIGLHVLAAFCLYALVRRTLLLPSLQTATARAAFPVALGAALLWAVHPLCSAAVAYVSQRTEILMALAMLFMLYALVRRSVGGGWRWEAAAVASCALGMAAKEVMVVAPLLAVLYDRTFLAGSFRGAWRERARLHGALAATWLLLGGLIVYSRLGDRGVGWEQGVGAGEYLLISSRAVVSYLRLALWPHGLVFDHGWVGAGGFRDAAPALVFCVGLVGATGLALVRSPKVGFGGAWLLLLLAPTSSFIPIVQQPVAESRMYLPLAGLVAWGVVGLSRGVMERSRALGWAGWVMLAAAGSVLTARRAEEFVSEIALWTATIAAKPDNARAYGHLGAAWLRADRLAESRTASEQALRLRPDYADAWVNLGVAIARSGRSAEAIPHYETALRIAPLHPEGHYNLGLALAEDGRSAEALTHFQQVLRRRPDHLAAQNNLSVVLLRLGRVAESVASARAAVGIDPRRAEAHYNLGNALARQGEAREAAAAFAAALRCDPRFAPAHNNLGVLSLRAGRPAEAAAHFEAALRLRPDYPEARRNLEAVRGR